MIKTVKHDTLMATLQQSYPGKVMWASEIPVGDPISTGSLALDFATGFGGFPSNRVVEVCGKEHTGKTTLALMTMLNALERYPDKAAIFLDLEHKIDKDWLEMIVGPDMLGTRIFYIQPTSIENATNIYRDAVETGEVCMAILDSIGGAPTVRRNDDAEAGHYGGNAIGVGEWSRSAATYASVYNTLTIGINQTRADMSGYNQLNLPGGKAWSHAPVLRVELFQGKDREMLKLPGEAKPVAVGYTVYAKIRKNQVGMPGRVAYWWFYNIPTEEHAFGIDTLDEITRLSIATHVVHLRGGWYHHQALPEDKKGEHKVQGLPALKEAVKTDEAFRGTLVGEVLASLQDHAAEVAPITDPDDPVDEGMMGLYLGGTESDG
jgi:recombination protein RecA